MGVLHFFHLTSILVYLQLVQVGAPAVTLMEISRLGTEYGTVDQAYETHRLDISNKEKEDLSDKLYEQLANPDLREESTEEHWFPECLVCDEMLPPPPSQSISAKISYNGDQELSQFNVPASLSGDDCCKMNGTEADCRNCSLTTIPSTLSPNITVLLLGHNLLTDASIAGGTFKRYPRLTLLSLSSNLITSLADDAFEGLPLLRCLCLQYNNIKMDERLNSSLTFQPLAQSLVYLRLNGFNKNTTNVNLMYPSYAISFLSKLKYLYIDGIPFAKFENPRHLLTNLTHLGMAGFRFGYCNLTGLQSEAFEFNTLTHLDISDCKLQGIYVNNSAFENLQSLQSITINNNFHLGIQTLGDLMHGQRNNKNLKVLTMQRINPRFSPCIAIYKSTLQNLKNTGLEEIYAMDNEIEIIEQGALQMLPKTLKILNLKANKIIFGDYIKDLATLTELTDLMLDGSDEPYHFPEQYPGDFLNNCIRNTVNIAQISKTIDAVKDIHGGISHTMSIPLPPKLFKIYMSGNGMAYTLNDISFSSPNQLVSADLSRNVFRNIYGPIRGLQNLTILQMDYCDIRYISDEFFDEMPSLAILSLYQNQLGKSLSTDENGDVFKNLKKLKLMNLSENNIYFLHPLVFKNMANIEHIDLSQNRLGKVDFSISHMKSLQGINLKANQIQRLSRETMAEIDDISKGRQFPDINLSFNPISCDCDSLEFLEWLTDRGQLNRTRPGDYYLCNMVKQPNGYGEVIERLRRECIKQDTLFAVVVSATMVAMVAIAIVLAYRFRWTLRYWYHAAKLKFQPVISPENYQFDVFVSYSDKDDFVEEELIPRLQDEFNFRVMMHGLNFPAGGHITDSIHTAVTTSRKTLVVITKNMLRSHWCNYELMMARRETIRRGKQVLVFLFLEDLTYSEMTSGIASYIRESTYITYPPEPCYRDAFWRKLVDDLRKDVVFT
ncbi:hypothetical protein EGW08_017976 [Elysia chlorotica]|uniref:TIR domain-containing protein n=1 Tax=Elysia chlorotica TaxID=188477 RepID=A0A3S1B3P0_ELYCH|nr:hypothetical protein EGW08_017976 [Elysia chlorotica]